MTEHLQPRNPACNCLGLGIWQVRGPDSGRIVKQGYILWVYYVYHTYGFVDL